MKTIAVYSVTLIMTILFAQSSAYAQKKNTYVEVKLETSAHSDMCKTKIENTLAYEKGIKNPEFGKESLIITLSYNPKKTNVEKIIKLINNLGHDAEEIKEEEGKKKE